MKTLNFIFITALLIWSSFSFADDSLCKNADVIQSVPRFLNKKSKKTFPYKFAFYKSESDPENKNLPVLIFIPGGPGETSIEVGTFSLNQNNHLIMTDPRSEGCNTGDFEATDLTSIAIANDLLGTVEWLQKNNYKHYVLLGTSYGTVVATILENLIEQKHLQRPSAVILNSTFAVYTENVVSSYVKFWEKLKKKLDPATLKIIVDKEKTFSKEISDLIDGGIAAILFAGSHLSKDSSPITAQEYLRDALNGGKLPFKEEFIEIANDEIKGQDESENSRLYMQVACNELEDCTINGEFKNGVVVYTKTKGKYIKNGRKYDSRNYLIHVPIYYFTGTDDPATPTEQTYYHLKTQLQTDRHLIVVPGLGHDVLDSLFDCRNQIIDSIISKKESLENVLKTCPAKTQYKKYPAIP